MNLVSDGILLIFSFIGIQTSVNQPTVGGNQLTVGAIHELPLLSYYEKNLPKYPYCDKIVNRCGKSYHS
jgi:hypothetical protein